MKPGLAPLMKLRLSPQMKPGFALIVEFCNLPIAKQNKKQNMKCDPEMRSGGFQL